jgi:hypothetical protein
MKKKKVNNLLHSLRYKIVHFGTINIQEHLFIIKVCIFFFSFLFIGWHCSRIFA